MARITERDAAILAAQGNLIFGHPPPANKPAAARPQRDRKARAELPENQVESLCKGWLEMRGWTVVRQQAGTFVGVGELLGSINRGIHLTSENIWSVLRPVRIGEKGRCDFIAYRPARREFKGLVEQFEAEFKAPGAKPTSEQLEYIHKRNALGYLAGWWDGLRNMQDWYVQHFDL